jgi:hypothetical protein
MRRAASLIVVTAGLDPAIHRSRCIFQLLMDARVRRAHDGLETGEAL